MLHDDQTQNFDGQLAPRMAVQLLQYKVGSHCTTAAFLAQRQVQSFLPFAAMPHDV
jgi:hypothetical protein